MHANTVFILFSGMVIFIFTDFIMKIVAKSPKISIDLNNKNNLVQEISVDRLKNFIIISFSMIITYVYYSETKKMVLSSGYAYGTNMTSYVRAILVGNLSTSYHISSIITQLYKIVVASSYIYLYMFINNCIALKNIGRALLKYFVYLFVPIIAVVGNMLIQGGRLTAIRFIIASFIYAFLIESSEKGRMKQTNIITFIKLVCLVLLVGILFYLSTRILGRGLNYALIEYVTNYFGGGIVLFDRYMQENRVGSSVFGEETFYEIIDFLRKLKLIHYDGIERLEFQYLGNGINNVYTGYRRLIEDFNITGMIALHSFMCLFYSYVYYIRVRPNIISKTSKMKGWILAYAYVFFCIVVHPFDTYFFQLISLNNIVIIFFIWIIWKFMFNLKICGKKIIIKK